MATIYGTPVVLLKKPDTSEEWIINSRVTDKSIITVNEKTNFVSNNEEFVTFVYETD